MDTCYAVQAGRELRVIVGADKLPENKSTLLARDIAGEIEKNLRYPGHIKVTVIRETRAVDYAR